MSEDSPKASAEYHRLTASLAKSLSLPMTSTSDKSLIAAMWKDKKAEKNMKKYCLCATLLFFLLIITAAFLLFYRTYLHATIKTDESSEHVYPIRNDTVLMEEKYLNDQIYTFSYNKNQLENIKNAEIYGILAFVHYDTNTPKSMQIQYSLANNDSLHTCFKKNKFSKNMSYVVATCDTQIKVSNYIYTLFKLNIDIPNNNYYQLQIYYLLLSTINVHYRYQISPFIEYNEHLYAASRYYYFGMPKKQITDGTYELNFVFDTYCQNNTYLIEQCRIGDADQSNVMFPDYFSRSDADKNTYCGLYCDEKTNNYHHMMDLKGGFDLMYLQESGFWIVLQYTFDENNIDKYSPFSIELYMDKKASIFRSGEFIGACVCIVVALCVVCVLIAVIKKQRKLTKYTATHRKLYKRFYNERDAILYQIFGKDIAFIIKEYLHALECIVEIKDETVWKGKMLAPQKQLQIN